MIEMKKKHKTLVIGIDGGDWNMILPLIKKGKLPTIKELMNNGVHGILKSTIPFQTIPAWISMFTGKDPGELGACDFFIPKDKRGNFFFPNSTLWKGEFIWDIVSKEEYNVGVLNVPGTYPAYKINGVMISSILTPSDEPSTYPKYLLRNVDYIIDQKDGPALIGKKKYFNELLEINRKRFEVFREIEDKHDFDLLILVFTITDRVQHIMIDNWEKIELIYRILDEEISWFIKRYDNILVVSDHGFAKLKKPFFINDWLEKEGILHRKSRYINSVWKFLPLKLLQRFTWLLPEKLKRRIQTGGDISFIDFEKSHAFSICDNSILVKDDKEIPIIMKKLKKIHFLKVFESRSLYRGISWPYFPQIIIEPEEGVFAYKFSEKFFRRLRKTGDHRRNGIFIISGENVNKRSKVNELDIDKIFHILLYSFGMKKKNTDSRFLQTIFKNYKKSENSLKIVKRK